MLSGFFYLEYLTDSISIYMISTKSLPSKLLFFDSCSYTWNYYI